MVNQSITSNAILVENISKSFGNVKALDNVSFTIGKGELFGFIGPDGSGKTTLFRLIATLLYPDEGSVKIFDYDIIKDFKKIRRMVGYMPGRFSLYQDLTVEENLKFYATIFGTTVKENYYLIEDIYKHIEPFKKRLAGRLSGGMKQKLALSCALIHKPQLLILDEPTTGVDAVSRKEFWEMLAKLKHEGISFIVSTPYMDEAVLCDRIALIQNGKIMAIDKPDNVIVNFKKQLFAVKSQNIYQLLLDMQKYKNTHSVFPFGQYLHYTDKNEIVIEEDIIKYLEKLEHKNIEINIINPSIEDCFMELMTN